MRWSSPGESTAARIELEQRTFSAMRRETRAFLVEVERMALAPALTAAAHDHFTLGPVAHRWEQAVRRSIVPIVARLSPTYVGNIDQALRSHPYLNRLFGRMMRSPLPEQAFTSARSVLIEASRSQWDTATVARHLTDALDMGTATTVDTLVKEGSTWDAMVRRIARTEATAAHNWHALEQLAEQGYTGKRWVAHHDAITRDTHLAADGQTQLLSSAFIVGSEALMVPGDPQGSPAVTYNCRCVIVGVGGPASGSLTAWYNPHQPRDAKGRWKRSALRQFDAAWAERGDRMQQRATLGSQMYAPEGEYDAEYEDYSVWKDYTQTGFVDLNAALRGGYRPRYWKPGTTAEDAAAPMDHMFDREGLTFDRDCEVTRSVRMGTWDPFGLGVPPPGEWEPGSVIEDKAFLSTSASGDVVDELFLSWGGFDEPGWFMRIKCRKGQRWLPGEVTQKEMILPRGTRMRVLSKNAATRELVLEVLD